jgi:TetR/AcrR family tetracycline transcriptional repressor
MYTVRRVGESVKGRRSRRARGSLSRAQVVDAALSLADERGVESLSMPQLARRLDCGVMTIYSYVADKDELLDAMVQRGLADLRMLGPLPTDPTGVLIAWGRALRMTLLQHPSLPAIFLSRVVIDPAIIGGVERLLRALARSGVRPGDGVHAIYAVLVYTVGFVAWELPRTHRQPQQAYIDAWRHALASHTPADIPLTAGIADELPRVADQEQFELGLTALANGLPASRT